MAVTSNIYFQHYLDLRDDADTFAAVASLAFWPAKQLASGNFTVCVPGIIDVCIRIHLNPLNYKNYNI